MMKSFAVAVVAGVLLLAGCGNVETQPQTEQKAVTQPPEPAAGAGGLPQGPVQPRTGASEPNEASTRPVRAEEGGAAAAGSAETALNGTRGGAKTENAGPTEGDAPVRAEPVVVKSPVRDRTPEPNDAKPTELIAVASAPAESPAGYTLKLRSWRADARGSTAADGRMIVPRLSIATPYAVVRCRSLSVSVK